MTNKEYKLVRSMVERADKYSCIWDSKHIWSNLTKKQTEDIGKVLNTKGFLMNLYDGKNEYHLLPSGIKVLKTI